MIIQEGRLQKEVSEKYFQTDHEEYNKQNNKQPFSVFSH